MPILPAEPCWFPAQLFEEPPVVDVLAERRWFVMHTKPRQEKGLGRQLHQAQLPFYLPLIARRSVQRGRVLTSHIPLFTSYCFVLADDRERVQALTTKRIVNALAVPDQDKLWHDLRQIHRLIATGAPITPEGRLVPGTPVEIRAGALAGLRGIIIRTAKQHRFVVQVDFIQRGASIELDEYMIARTG